MLNLKNAFALTAAVMLTTSPAFAAGKKASLADLIEKRRGSWTDSQKVAADAIQRFGKSHVTCEAILGVRNRPATTESILETSPGWLIEAAERAFVDKENLDPRTLAMIEEHKFLTAVTVNGDADEEIKSAIHRALLEASPISAKEIGRKVSVEIKNISASSNTVGFKLTLTFDNGQVIPLQFRNVEIGVKSKSETIAHLTTAAIFSRTIVTSEDRLRQEMNALAYDMKKAMRLAPDGVQQKLAALISTIEENQPKKGLLSGLFSGSTFFTGIDAILGKSFQTYITAKSELIEMAQQKQSKAAAATGSRKAARDKRVQYVERSSRALRTGKNSAGFYAPRETSSDFATFLWIYDPMYMLSHPWYWGASNNSFMHYWMIYDWISHSNARDSHFRPSEPVDMRHFDHPVDPTFTARDDRPFVNPWDREDVRRDEIIVPNVDRHGAVTWTDQTGREAHVVEQSIENVSSRWNEISGQSHSRPVEADLSEKESSSFTRGSDGGGWGQQPTITSHPERDSSISGY